ncbi:DUF7537 family lipoprotein [Halostella litorea]|uniref:DUF7537 family lipoprotein n=1 Tax=Halostella litorea TaxID=2528831 RepID=UPI001092AB79|nr:hypothetical protein [Halostella litorea]
MERLELPSARGTVATLLVAMLVLTAGCSAGGLLGGGDGNGNGDSGSIEPYTDSGDELTGEMVNESHTSAIQSAGSYTLESNVSLTGADSSLVQNAHGQVDLENDRQYAVQFASLFGNRTTYRYTADNTTYQRIVPEDGETQYQTSEGGQIANPSINTDNVDAFEWEQQGTETHEGVGVTRYEATGVANYTALPTSPAEENVSDVSATLLVSEDGVMHEYRVDYTQEGSGSTQEISLRYAVTDVGSTTVEEPGWLDEARNSSGN